MWAGKRADCRPGPFRLQAVTRNLSQRLVYGMGLLVCSLHKLPVGVDDMISGRNVTKCVRKSASASGRSAEAAAPRVGSGSPVCAT